ncbi:MAG: pyruvate:ferredoxin (flavodoxin) oxidoreductase, partial [Oscillospiraceae bacterium]
QQTVKALVEAESYNGPSIVIGYAPCEMHGVKGGMTNCQSEMKRAVDAGYWHMFRFNPTLKAEGKNPFTIDSKPATTDYQEFIRSETRYSRLSLSFPERADMLFNKASENAKDRYDHLTRLVELYK